MTRSELLERAKPILFNTEMVRAIQDGRKTVTRRVAFPNADLHEFISSIYPNGWWFRGRVAKNWDHILYCVKRENPCKYRNGDILYVRETWYYESAWHELTAGEPDLPSGRYLHRYVYKAERPDYTVDVGVGAYGWKPSIHMPKEAARIFLRVTGIRMERLQDIDDDGVVAEGLEIGAPYDELWNSTVKKSDLEKYGWNANPWVWVIEFERVEVSDD